MKDALLAVRMTMMRARNAPAKERRGIYSEALVRLSIAEKKAFMPDSKLSDILEMKALHKELESKL